jgi:hypothetical protein
LGDDGSVVLQPDEDGIEMLEATVPERSTCNLLEQVETRYEEPQPQVSEQQVSNIKECGFSMCGEGEEEGTEFKATALERSACKGKNEQESARHGAEREITQKEKDAGQGKVSRQHHEAHESLHNAYRFSVLDTREDEQESVRNRSEQDDTRDYYNSSQLETFDDDDTTLAIQRRKHNKVVLHSKYGGKLTLTPWCLVSANCVTTMSV